VNIRVVLDGEEEIGSPTLRRLVRERPELFRADAALVSDTRMLGPGRPTLVYGLRGKLDAELVARGPGRELHSGQFGGVASNPANALCALVGSLARPDGRVALAGFYDGVRMTDIADPAARPALDVNGLLSGYTGPGAKGIVPARATAKFSCRLAPGQQPDRIGRDLRRHFERRRPDGIDLTLKLSGGRPALELNRYGAAQRAAVAAATAAFGRLPVFVRSGGSMTAPLLFRDRLGLESVLLGFSLPDDGLHGPRERAHIPTLECGVIACAYFLDEFARAGRLTVAA